MIGAWTKHIQDPEEKIRFENKIKGSKAVLDRLMELVKEDEEAVDRSEMDIKSFDTPNWDYRNAWRNGFRACLYKYERLLNLDQ